MGDELTKGEATLASLNGKVVRVVEVDETVKGNNRSLNRLPAVKRKSDENQFYSATRVLKTNTKIDPNSININEKEVGIVEEEKDSASYPGISSVYRKRIITATVV